MSGYIKVRRETVLFYHNKAGCHTDPEKLMVSVLLCVTWGDMTARCLTGLFYKGGPFSHEVVCASKFSKKGYAGSESIYIHRLGFCSSDGPGVELDFKKPLNSINEGVEVSSTNASSFCERLR